MIPIPNLNLQAIRIGFRLRNPNCYEPIPGYVFRGTGIWRDDGNEFTDEDVLFLKIKGIGEEFKKPIYKFVIPSCGSVESDVS